MSLYMKNETAMNDPEEVGAVVTAGSTATVTLEYTKPDGQAVITVTDAANSSPLDGATVDCFSDKGGAVQTKTDSNGNATCACTSQDIWYALAYIIQASDISISEVSEIYCDEEGTPSSLITEYVATMPEAVSLTIPDAKTQGGTGELTDGFSVAFPAGSLGEGEVTVNIAPTLTPFKANKRPASLWAYSVSAQDQNGTAITQLASPAVFTVPVDQTHVEKQGLTLTDIEVAYYDPSIDHYKKTDNGSVLTEMDGQYFIKFEQTHLTDFAIVGNGYLGTVQGEDGGAIGFGGDGSGDSGSTGGNKAGGGGCSLTPNNSDISLAFIVGGLLIVIATLAFKKIQVARQKIKK